MKYIYRIGKFCRDSSPILLAILLVLVIVAAFLFSLLKVNDRVSRYLRESHSASITRNIAACNEIQKLKKSLKTNDELTYTQDLKLIEKNEIDATKQEIEAAVEQYEHEIKILEPIDCKATISQGPSPDNLK